MSQLHTVTRTSTLKSVTNCLPDNTDARSPDGTLLSQVDDLPSQYSRDRNLTTENSNTSSNLSEELTVLKGKGVDTVS